MNLELTKGKDQKKNHCGGGDMEGRIGRLREGKKKDIDNTQITY